MRFDEHGKPIATSLPERRDPVPYVLAALFLGILALIGAVWGTQDMGRYDSRGMWVGSSPLPVIVIGESPTPTETPILCTPFLEVGTVCKFVPTETPVGACPLKSTGYCIYDGPQSLLPPKTPTPDLSVQQPHH